MVWWDGNGQSAWSNSQRGCHSIETLTCDVLYDLIDSPEREEKRQLRHSELASGLVWVVRVPVELLIVEET